MEPLAIFSEHTTEPIGYTDRETVKAVIINDNDEVLLFQGQLPGGGVESGETLNEALARECMEEIGATIEIMKPIGTAIAYRDELKLRYVFTGFICKLISQTTQTTTQDDEKGLVASWEDRTLAIARTEKEIQEVIAKGKEFFGLENYQRKIANRMAIVAFLKAVGK